MQMTILKETCNSKNIFNIFFMQYFRSHKHLYLNERGYVCYSIDIKTLVKRAKIIDSHALETE